MSDKILSIIYSSILSHQGEYYLSSQELTRVYVSGVIAIFWVFTCLLFPSCSTEPNPNQQLLTTLPNTCIPISSKQINDYRYYDTFIAEDEIFLLGVNTFYSSFDLFSITENSYIKSFPIKNSGPNAIVDIIGIKLIDLQIVWIFTHNNFFIYDLWDQKVKISYSLSSLNNKFSLAKYSYFFDNHGKIVSPSDSTVLLEAGYFPLYRGSSQLNLVSLNVNNGTLRDLPIGLPKWLNSKHHFAGLNVIQYNFYRGKIIYNYPFSDSLYQYDNHTGVALEPLQLNSPFLPSIVSPYSGGTEIADIVGYSSASDYYMGFHGLGKNEAYLYRFIIQTEPGEHLQYSTHVEVFDHNELIGSKKICNDCKTRAFSFRDTIYLFTEGRNEDQLCFERVSVSKSIPK